MQIYPKNTVQEFGQKNHEGYQQKNMVKFQLEKIQNHVLKKIMWTRDAAGNSNFSILFQAIIYSLVIGDDTEHKVFVGAQLAVNGIVEGTDTGVVQRNLRGRGVPVPHPAVDLGQGPEELIHD